MFQGTYIMLQLFLCFSLRITESWNQNERKVCMQCSSCKARLCWHCSKWGNLMSIFENHHDSSPKCKRPRTCGLTWMLFGAPNDSGDCHRSIRRILFCHIRKFNFIASSRITFNVNIEQRRWFGLVACSMFNFLIIKIPSKILCWF